MKRNTRAIRVELDVYNKLCKRGRYGDTMNDIIKRLMERPRKDKPKK